MRAAKSVLLVGATLLGAPGAGWPKGVTVRIHIEGDYLESPIEITDPVIVGRFSIWNGPGVSTSSHGKADPPAWADASRAWDETVLPLVARHASPAGPSPRRAELGCTIGTAVVTAGGAIAFIGRDQHGRERVLNRLQSDDPSCSGIRALIGDVPIGQATDVSCWPARD